MSGASRADLRDLLRQWTQAAARMTAGQLAGEVTEPNGAPLSGGSEFSEPDFAVTGADGQAAIPADAHIRLASFEHNGGTRILRRGCSYTDGVDPQTGMLVGGQFFIAFMKNPSSSSSCRPRWPPTRLTSTSTMWAARSSPARRAFPPASTGVTDCSPDARHAGRRCRRLTAVRSACRSCSVVPPQMP